MLSSKSVVAITGASGMLGTMLRSHLCKQGVQVISIDQEHPVSQGAPCLDFQISLPNDRICDFADYNSCQHIFEDCTHVVHLAASGDAAAGWDQVLPNNIHGMINATNAAKHAGTVSRFVFASTNHTYHANTMGAAGPGSFSNAKMIERGGPGKVGVSAPFAPDSNYAVSKIFGESLGSYVARIEKAYDFVALRIGWCAYDTPLALEGTIHDEVRRWRWETLCFSLFFVQLCWLTFPLSC